ncbi:transcriptional regulator, LysR family [Trichormus variabilis ATCC 29413]|uniref:Transcriptional regulator, LysR family n=4 Tax=Anabaena variabilis TaxID=264691 RepID=Q3MAT6_TRIV2|nr:MULTISPECIES: LysR family transcriptional regulator [Nostocaceae]ABA21900.1 transcriptional regulator, LysR family [Trichormus variabilis ATCC 29413]MBC1213403.1 LysR family transcriptional regulator [Trichormus variabilis ARAD]MBC1269727.1 LysR family transcriptional regulator [Trichormus variabilis FSR]MBC1302395.1 LysR family transcriptional regulator [Trichormus variabilis N2B]MBC1310304.1 LysR family transcriptional regulator [Trichormus variabilis PNB]
MNSYLDLIHRDSLLNSLSLEHLRIFEAIARHKSFTRAAEELFTTQPSVSRHIKQLTETIGLPLFKYVDNCIQLTPTGEELLVIYQEIFQYLENFDTKLVDLKDSNQGCLKVSAVTTSKYVITNLLQPFCKLYPDIRIALEFTNHEVILTRIQENADDFYILGYPPKKEDIEIKPFLDNPLVVVAPSNHPFVKQSSISLERLAKEQLIMRERGSETRMAVEMLFAERGIRMPVKLEVSSNNATKQAVIEGLGLAVLSIHTLYPELQRNQLSILNVKGFPILQQWQIAYPKKKWLSPIVSTFLEYLLTEGVRTKSENF